MPSVFARPTQRRVPVYDEFDLEEQDDAQVEPHEPVEVEPVPSLREAFLAAVQDRVAQDPRITTKKWVRNWVKRNSAGGCMYCGHAMAVEIVGRQASADNPVPSTPLSSVLRACVTCFTGPSVDLERAWVARWKPAHMDALTAKRRRAFMDTLIPLSAGGDSSQSNLVIACTTCCAEKGERDWITFGKAVQPDVLVAKRRKALLEASNHVLPLTVKGSRAARDVLEQRWSNPRFRMFAGVFATCGLFAWDGSTVPSSRRGEVVLALRFGFNATVTQLEDGWVLAELPPDTWFDAAWTLVQDNVLLQPVELSGRPALVYRPYRPTLADEHKERWWVLLEGSRWVQEARRVQRWSVQAQHLQLELQREEWSNAINKPMLDGFASSKVRIAQIFSEVL